MPQGLWILEENLQPSIYQNNIILNYILNICSDTQINVFLTPH